MKGLYTFNAPSALLYRSSVIREADPFYPGSGSSADTAACLTVLKHWDFGFVHKILSFERVHDESITSRLALVNSFLLDRIEFLLRYGVGVLTDLEQKDRLEELLEEYYKYLAVGIIHVRGRSFWEFHLSRLNKLGLALSWRRLAIATATKVLELALNPQQTARKLIRACKYAVAHTVVVIVSGFAKSPKANRWDPPRVESSND